jgi:S-adenosylhomocysteine hydrolase
MNKISNTLSDELSVTMPVLDFYKSQVEKQQHAFNGVVILYVNHCISDSLLTARAFRDLVPKIYSVVIPYGSQDSLARKKVIDGFSELGKVYVPKITHPKDFMPAMEKSIFDALIDLDNYCRINQKKFIVIEDGGYVLPMLHDDKNLSNILENCLGFVEHTSRGMWNYQYLERDGIPRTPRALSKPAITIASTQIKTFHEPIFVGQAIVDEICFLLKKKHDFLQYKNLTIIGTGRVGIGIAKVLQGYRTKTVFVDKSEDSLQRAKAVDEKISTKLALTSELLKETDIIIGATGVSSLPPDILIEFINQNMPTNRVNQKKFFVSASSKNLEFFEAINIMEVLTNDSQLIKQKLIDVESIESINEPDYGLTYVVKYKTGNVLDIVFLASGYPVIFFPSHSHGAPNKAMDPIMTELFIAFIHMAILCKELDNKVYLLNEVAEFIKNSGQSSNLIKELFDEDKILSVWCEFNSLNFEEYKQAIQYRGIS